MLSPQIIDADTQKSAYLNTHTYTHTHRHQTDRVGCAVMDIVVRNGHSDSSSKLGRGCLHFTLMPLRKV